MSDKSNASELLGLLREQWIEIVDEEIDVYREIMELRSRMDVLKCSRVAVEGEIEKLNVLLERG